MTTALDASDNSSNSDRDGENLSWVAAPVVGGVAALLVVGVLLIMFRKRRNGGKGEATPGRLGAMFGARGKTRGREKGMERLEDAEGKVPVYEVKAGRVALKKGGEGRRSMAGLFMTKA